MLFYSLRRIINLFMQHVKQDQLKRFSQSRDPGKVRLGKQ